MGRTLLSSFFDMVTFFERATDLLFLKRSVLFASNTEKQLNPGPGCTIGPLHLNPSPNSQRALSPVSRLRPSFSAGSCN